MSQGVNTSPLPPDEFKITEERSSLENRMIKSSAALSPVNQIEEYATDEEDEEES